MPAERFRQVLDDLVLFAIRLQEQVGLDVISDGEWRRSQYIREFLDRVGGFERCRRFTHQGETKLTEVVVRRMTATEPINTHGMVMPIGRHAGTPITRLPVSYLLWMDQSAHSMANVARAELKRRGTTRPTLDVSNHAIDRASLPEDVQVTHFNLYDSTIEGLRHASQPVF